MRARYEHQIHLTERLTCANNCVERTVENIIWRHGKLDLSWFTDDQIAEIRDAMISREWSGHKFRREQRKQALAILESQKETA